MLVFIWALRDGFKGRSRTWWTIALVIQFWHHIEHALLQGQAIAGANLANSPVPISLVQMWVPRVELHLFYNSVAIMPMAVAMYYHMFPSKEDEAQHGCSCAWSPRETAPSGATPAASRRRGRSRGRGAPPGRSACTKGCRPTRPRRTASARAAPARAPPDK